MRQQVNTKKWSLLTAILLLVTYNIVPAQPLRLDAHMTKPSYLEGEPIVVMLSLTNGTPAELTVAEPLVLEGFVGIKVTTSDGKEPNEPRCVWDVMMPPPDYGVILKSGQSLRIAWSLNETYVFGLKPCRYELDAIYDTTKHSASYPRIWHGKINAMKISFRVETPPPEEKYSYTCLLSASKIILDYQSDRFVEARNLLLDLIRKKPDSVYVPYATYLIGESYFIKQADKKQHFAEAAEKFDEFLKKMPDYPYYSEQVRTTKLPFALLQTGQYARALEIVEKAPDGYYKQRMISQIQKKL